jgi:hypothetical protein
VSELLAPAAQLDELLVLLLVIGGRLLLLCFCCSTGSAMAVRWCVGAGFRVLYQLPGQLRVSLADARQPLSEVSPREWSAEPPPCVPCTCPCAGNTTRWLPGLC